MDLEWIEIILVLLACVGALVGAVSEIRRGRKEEADMRRDIALIEQHIECACASSEDLQKLVTEISLLSVKHAFLVEQVNALSSEKEPTSGA